MTFSAEPRNVTIQRRGFLVILSGPSSAGKSTLLEAIRGLIPGLKYSVSVTTRPKRPGEKNGEDYFFVSEEEFRRMAAEGSLLEWAEYCGYLYGTPRDPVQSSIGRGEIIITDINIDGARQIRQTMPEGVFVFLMPPSMAELHKRIRRRGTDSEEAMARRLAEAVEEMKAVSNYDYCILNDNLAEAKQNLVAIVNAERCRVERTDLTGLALEETIEASISAPGEGGE